jgi:hypothetical protein
VVLCLCSLGVANAQEGALSEVRLFQTFFRDAAAPSSPYGEGVLGFSNYENGSVLNLGLRGGFPVTEQITLGAGLAFLNSDPDVGSGESGISDLRVVGVYHLPTNAPASFSVGGFLTLPIGSDDLGQGEANFGGFGAVRYPVATSTVITGTLSLEFLEGAPVGAGGWPAIFVQSVDREVSLLFGGGVIHQLNSQFSLVGELNFATEGDFGLLTGGVDYQLQSGSRLRGNLGLGLDDGAPDVSILIGFLHALR